MQKSDEFLSRNGEDTMIKKFIDILNDDVKWCVEFGAWDGKHSSNTYHFISQEAYKAVLVEGDSAKFSQLSENMKPYPVDCFNTYVSFEGDNTLDNLLGRTKIPHDFTFLSIDIDGNDYHIWESFQNYRPKLVIIEFNPSISNEVEFIQPKDMSLNQGCSPLSLIKLAKEKVYELIASTENNLIFVDKQYFALFDIKDNSLYKLRTDLSLVTYIFNGYDGHVFVRGFNQMYLYTMPYNEKRMQLMPTCLQEWNARSAIKRFLQRIHRSLKKRNII